ncbi:acyl-CoA dehydrogenase family protein [Ramlibacter sp. AW1]|uniref:Acyl-CoA dehydrogenase family protein n=1 Tax=Ramlibacter aurantiacus TaxID=2801330 RepID=A0A936ZD22_9BURK|nr:acyl-CoA dehydrogenase family protein [Ramlibacter aurantiacus]MBL0419379.1 acyl-CoA dehydrogenase family protein [Ramlibacter aurantiacus]
MNFTIEPELRMLRDSVRRFVDEELMPLEPLYANEPDIPDEVRQRLQSRARELGFWSFDVPEEHGGGGIGMLGMCLVFEELGRCNVPSFRAQTVLTPYLGPVLYHCTPEQKEKYLYPVVRGDKRTCFALTEPGAGSDPARMRTTAVLEGDHWRINGTKVFITSADKADFVQVFARTVVKGEEVGVSCFLVDKGTPGFRLGQSFELMSPDRPWEVVLEDVRLPVSQLVGEPGKGWELAREFLDVGRLIHGPKSIGRAERALQLAISYANQRSTFGQPLAKRQAIQWMVADSATELHAARLMTYHAAWKADQGLDYHLEASQVKLYADEMYMRVVDRAIQIHGGIGLSRELPLELMFRDARSRLITEGSSEMQRIIIASEMLKR